MRIGWVGFHKEGIPALRAMLERGYEVSVIVTLTPESAAKRSAAADDYPAIAKEFNILLHETENINHPATVELLRGLDLDVIFVIGWSQIVHPEVLQLPRLGMIGAHASLLPHNRGSAPVNWALIRGEDQGGNTLIWLAEDVDGGYIIDQMQFPITQYDTCDTLYDKVANSNREMILRVLPRLIAGERPGFPQPATNEPLLPRRRPKHGLIDWTQNSRDIYNFVRALTRPYPGAFTWLEGRCWWVWHSACLPLDVSLGKPGELIGPVVSPIESSCGLLVACGVGALVLLEMESEEGPLLRGPALSDMPWTGKVFGNE